MSRRSVHEGRMINVMPRSGRCFQTYRTRSKVRILMKDGVPCNEEVVVTVTTREPRLPFNFGKPTQ